MSELAYFRELNQRPEQQNFLSIISKSRGYLNNDILNSYRAIFVPSGREMMEMLGNTSIANQLFLPDGRSMVPGKLLIPGFSPLGYLVTFVVYDAKARLEATETGVYDRPYYFYPDESTGFKKSNFILMPYESWEKAIETKEISLADGVFDSGAVCLADIPCGSILGSTLGVGVKNILSIFNKIRLFKDNDMAGTALYLELEKYFPNVELTKIPYLIGKDIDGYITEEDITDLKEKLTYAGTIELKSRGFGRKSSIFD